MEPEPRTYSPSPPAISAIRPSGNKDVRFVKRQLTSLVNDGIAIRDEVDKTEKVLGHMMFIANDISGDIRELSWVRSKIEGDVLRTLKSDRTLWDGTRVMTDLKARKNWERFLKELKAEEKAAAEKRELELELERQGEELYVPNRTLPECSLRPMYQQRCQSCRLGLRRGQCLVGVVSNELSTTKANI